MVKEIERKDLVKTRHNKNKEEKKMVKEIERKFLLRELPEELNKIEGTYILQSYISTDPEVRIRKKNDKFFLTKKVGSGLTRGELERAIPEEIFNILWDATRDNRIEKIRYEVDGFEIDQYFGDLSGLYIAEIELESEDQKFEFPEMLKNIWKLEVTEDAGYKNQKLASCGFPDGYNFDWSFKILETVITDSADYRDELELWMFPDKFVATRRSCIKVHGLWESRDSDEYMIKTKSRKLVEEIYREYVNQNNTNGGTVTETVFEPPVII